MRWKDKKWNWMVNLIRWTVTATARLTSTSFSQWWPRSWRRPTSRRTSGRPSGSLTRTVAGMYITVLLIAITLLLCFCPSFFLVLQSKESRQIYSPLSLCGAYWAWNEYSEYFEKRTSAESRAGREVDEFCIKPSTSFSALKIFFPILELWNFDKKRQDDCEKSAWKQGSKKVKKTKKVVELANRHHGQVMCFLVFLTTWLLGLTATLL